MAYLGTWEKGVETRHLGIAQPEKTRHVHRSLCERGTTRLDGNKWVLSLIQQPRDGEDLTAFYRDFRDRHGVRPTASEVQHAGFKPGRTGHAGWLGFVNDMGDLIGDTYSAWAAHKGLLDEIRITRMPRSYKMLALRGMIEAGAFPGRIIVADLAERVARLAPRNPEIKRDPSVDPDDAAAIHSLLTTFPLKLLGETEWFRLGPGTFERTIGASHDHQLSELASELFDWRLLRHFQTQSVRYDQPDTPRLAEAAEPPGSRPISPVLGPKIWEEYHRQRIPPLFDAVFNNGSWNSGIVVIKDVKAMILLVTMDKRSMSVGDHYADEFVSPTRFVWQTQTSTRRTSSRSKIISGQEPGWKVHLFVRKSKLRDGRAAPFRYAGPVRFAGWEGEGPITVQWEFSKPLPDALRPLFGLQ